MNYRSALTKPISNSRGLLTADFLFSMVLCSGICMVLFVLNISLAMAEVAQYMVFSTARAHAAAHVDQDKQEELGKDKYRELLNNPVLKPLFSAAGANWFKLSETPDIRGGGATGRSFSEFYPDTVPDRVPQIGARIQFSPRILNIKVPFLGSTAEDPDAPFTAHLTGLLIREPSQRECFDQIKSRYSSILNLDPRFKELGSSGANKYFPSEDNGC